MPQADQPALGESRLGEHGIATRARISPAGALLAAGWLAIPAIQYYGTAERTEYQISGADPRSASGLVEWDLTPAYVILVVLTLIHVLRMAMHRGGNQRPPTALNEAAGNPGGAA